MMGIPGMRSAILPARAFLDVERVRFLARLAVRRQQLADVVQVSAFFDGQGGQLAIGPR